MKIFVFCLFGVALSAAASLNIDDWGEELRDIQDDETSFAVKRDYIYHECHQVADIGLVIDSSRSINHANFTKGLKFIEHFASSFKIGPDAVRFAAITFDRGIHKEDAFQFNKYTDKDSLIDAIQNVNYNAGDYTSTGEGIEYMRDVLMRRARVGVTRFGIVITDGKSQDELITKAQARKARGAGIKMIAIGVGDVDNDELKRIASGAEFILKAGSYSDLSRIFDPLMQLTCNKCYHVADIALVIDSSVSIPPHDFTKSLDFASQFADRFVIGRDGVRFGAITFSNGIHEEDAIQLNQYTGKDSLIRALKRMPHREGAHTSTGEGIKYMRRVIMRKARVGVPHFGIVITDGQSQERVKTQEEARKARKAGITMIAIGVGDIDDEELRLIASGKQNILKAGSYTDLLSITDPLMQLTCHKSRH